MKLHVKPVVIAVLCLALSAGAVYAAVPVLSKAMVSPQVGYADKDDFTVSVQYQNADGDPPTEAVLVVVLPAGGEKAEFPYTNLGSIDQARVRTGVTLTWDKLKFKTIGKHGFYFRVRTWRQGESRIYPSEQSPLPFYVRSWWTELAIRAGACLGLLLLFWIMHRLLFVRLMAAPSAAVMLFLSWILSVVGTVVWVLAVPNLVYWFGGLGLVWVIAFVICVSLR